MLMQGAAVVTVLHENLVHSNSSTLYCIHTMCMIMQYAHNWENYFLDYITSSVINPIG